MNNQVLDMLTFAGCLSFTLLSINITIYLIKKDQILEEEMTASSIFFAITIILWLIWTG